MRIDNQIEDEKEFLVSDVYKNDETINLIKDFEGVLEFESY